MKPIIALSGKAGHGKDSFYRLVLAPEGYHRIGLADPVKAVYLHRLALPDTSPVAAALHYYQAFGAAKTVETRRALQQIGTDEVRAHIDPFFWIWLALREIKVLVEGGERVAVTDCRFPNEAAALRGDREAVWNEYRTLQERGGATDPRVMHDLMGTWDEGGLLPPPGMGWVVRVINRNRGGLEGEAGRHASERGVEEIIPDLTVEAASLLELKARGRALLGLEGKGLPQTLVGWIGVELVGGPLHGVHTFVEGGTEKIFLPPGIGEWLYRRDPTRHDVFVYEEEA